MVKKVLEKLVPKGSFKRNTLILMTGTGVAQGLTVLAAPILTRLYAPEDFGVFGLFVAITGVLIAIGCWRYEMAIVLPEKDEDAANLLALSIILSVFMGFVMAIIVLFFKHDVAELLNAPAISSWLWLMPISLIAGGGFNALNYWATRKKRFNQLAISRVSRSTCSVSSQICFGVLTNTRAGGLLGGQVFGQLVATVVLAIQVFQRDKAVIFKGLSLKGISNALRRYSNFPLFSSWSALLNSASQMLPAFMLGYFFNTTIVGFYTLGHRVLSIPMTLIGQSIAQVFFPQAAEAKRMGYVDKLSLNVFQKLLHIGLTPTLLLVVIAPELFSCIFGKSWTVAGEYVQWLSIWLLFVFVSSPISTLFEVLERQHLGLVFNIVLFISRLLALAIGGWFNNALLAVALFGVTGALFWIFHCVWLLVLAGNSLRVVGIRILLELMYALPFLAVPLGFRVFSASPNLVIITALGAGLLFCYYLIKKEARASGVFE